MTTVATVWGLWPATPATGTFALNGNTTGTYNTANGVVALFKNATGNYNTADGAKALSSNTGGLYNTAVGYGAMIATTTGGYDTAAGVSALWRNTTGAKNTAVGVNVMLNNTTGSDNVAIGYQAGGNLTTGSNNIDIGSPGAAAESNTIRIGVQGGQKATYVGGISGALVIGSDVVIAANGRLGVVMSSARYKHGIRDMSDASSRLLKLRPVTFRYNEDAGNTLQYGLVAEEVEKIYPGARNSWDRWQASECAIFDAKRDAAQRAAETGSHKPDAGPAIKAAVGGASGF